jgi:hypothetical protein
VDDGTCARDCRSLTHRAATLDAPMKSRWLNILREMSKDAATSAQLRGVRRKYLHLLSQTHAQVAPDARRAYEDALEVVAVVLGQTFNQGAVVLRPDLLAYLAEKGIVQVEPKSDGA